MKIIKCKKCQKVLAELEKMGEGESPYGINVESMKFFYQNGNSILYAMLMW